jgi:putative transcriptional regulator
MVKHAFVPDTVVAPKRAAAKKVGRVGVAKTAGASKKAPPMAKSIVKLIKKPTRTDADLAALDSLHSLVQGMFNVGGIDKKTMRQFDDLCLPKVPAYDPFTIVQIRKKAKVSQNLLAAYLNTSASTVQKWETGAKKPSGPAAKLLQIIEKHGIDVLG